MGRHAAPERRQLRCPAAVLLRLVGWMDRRGRRAHRAGPFYSRAPARRPGPRPAGHPGPGPCRFHRRLAGLVGAHGLLLRVPYLTPSRAARRAGAATPADAWHFTPGRALWTAGPGGERGGQGVRRAGARAEAEGERR